MRRKWHRLLQGDPLGLSLVEDAATAFTRTKADRDLLERVNKDAKALAEYFLNEYLARGLDSQKTDEVRKELCKLRIERSVKGVPSELKAIYKHLEIIRDFGGRTVELDYPQSMVDPLMLRAYPPQTIANAGRDKGVEVGRLVWAISRAYREMGLSADNLAPEVASEYEELSAPLLLSYMDINATKVYFMGPVFYGNAGKSWTLTFATGSGLPDPYEWHGADWFIHEYGASHDLLVRHGLKPHKNSYRATNFSVGICNPLWSCKRLYIWQRSKTANQMKNARNAAREVGYEEKYLCDAVAQFISVLRTPNLKVLEIEEFPQPLTAFTRVSRNDIMLSCRPGTPEEAIAHAVWLRPGLRLSDDAITAIKAAAAGLTALTVERVMRIGPVLSVLAGCGVGWLLDRVVTAKASAHRQAILDMEKNVKTLFQRIWEAKTLPGLVKQARQYNRSEAIQTSCRTIAGLLGDVTASQCLDAFRKYRHP